MCVCALGQMSIHSILALTITSIHMFHDLKSIARKWRMCVWFSIENQHLIHSMTEEWSSAVEWIQCSATGLAIFDVCMRVECAQQYTQYALPVYCVWFINLESSKWKFSARFTSMRVICFEICLVLKFDMNATVYFKVLCGINCMDAHTFLGYYSYCTPNAIMHENLMVVFLICGDGSFRLLERALECVYLYIHA